MKTSRFILISIFIGSFAVAKTIELTLPPPYNDAQNEYSGLAWAKDYLILLPQYPTGYLVALSRDDLSKAIDSDSDHSVTPIRVPFRGGEFTRLIPGYEGFEALAFKDTTVFFSIESETRKGLKGYFVSGHMPSLSKGITLDPTNILDIPTPVTIDNMAFEALILEDDHLIPLYEANGIKVNRDPWVHIISTNLTVDDKIPFPNIEYRITDATQPDEHGKFWVINYLWRGDYRKLKPVKDGIENPFGKVTKHTDVERLIEIEFRDDHFYLTNTPPVYLTQPEKKSRNWEGIVRFENRGFILITDEYPQTILMFVPHNFD